MDLIPFKHRSRIQWAVLAALAVPVVLAGFLHFSPDPAPSICSVSVHQNNTSYMTFPRFPPGTTGTSAEKRWGWSHLPLFRFHINEEGLRDNNISRPAKRYRVLVIGDQETFGVGVNRTQRYTEIAEQQLRPRYDIEIINAGIPGAGMRDYYHFLRNRGIEYRPDLVVVAFRRFNAISKRRYDRWAREIQAMFNQNRSSIKEMQRPSRMMDQRIDRFLSNLTWASSEIRRYGNAIQGLSEQEGFGTLFYNLNRPQDLTERFRSNLRRWNRTCELFLVMAPQRFTAYRPTTYYINGTFHYNAVGHRWLGEKLAATLRSDLQNGRLSD